MATRRIRLGLGVFAEVQNLSLASLLRTGRGLLRSGHFDAIVSTSPPEVTHFAAWRLAREFGVPWVADFRDLWYSDMRVGQFEWASAVMTGIARRMLRDAALVVTVSQGLAERLRSAVAAPVAVCYNGFVYTIPNFLTGKSHTKAVQLQCFSTNRVYNSFILYISLMHNGRQHALHGTWEKRNQEKATKCSTQRATRRANSCSMRGASNAMERC